MQNARSAFLAVSSIALAAAPKCPLCVYALIGAFGAAGAAGAVYAAWLAPLTIGCLALTVGAMAWRARAERRYARLIAGVCAAAAMLAGRFLFDSRLLAYAGGAALLAAALWRMWPRPNDCPRQGECR
jgi:hypothetical protein